MDNYIVSLTLSYLKTKSNGYDLSDMMSFLGFTQNQMDKLILFLRKNEFVDYLNFELRVTNKGLRYLIIQNQINSSLENSEYEFSNIDKTSAIPIDKPYVPEKFLKKL